MALRPDDTWALQHAYKEIKALTKWAEQVGMTNVAPRLGHAQRLLAEVLNRHNAQLPKKQR